MELLYSTDGGVTYPNTITASAPNNGNGLQTTYAWTIPNVPTPLARVSIIDTADNTVNIQSGGNFHIEGFFTITSPNGGEVWDVASQQNISWIWGGSIPIVILSYSTDSGVTFPNIIDATAPNGTGPNGSYSYSWTVPDNISSHFRVKIQDANDSTDYGVSAADAKIQGTFSLTSPVGGERWVTNEIHNITWTNVGTMPNVELQYSTDSGVTYPNLIVASIPNNSSYPWTIPDPKDVNNNPVHPTTARVMVSDADDNSVYSASGADFKIDYYNITWTLLDLLTNEPLNNLSVIEGPNGSTAIEWQAAGLASPVTHSIPYGSWTASWVTSGYGAQAQNFGFNYQAGIGDQSFTLYLQTTSVHIWTSVTNFTYNATSDTLETSSWLQRDGIVVSGAASIKIQIYNNSGTLIKTLTSNSLTSGGIFNINWSPTTLSTGTNYTTMTTITNASGATFATASSFDITTASTLNTEVNQLTATQNTVNSVLDVPISQVQTNLQQLLVGPSASTASVVAQGGIQGIVSTQLNNQTQIISNATNNMEAEFNSVLTSFETNANEAVAILQAGATTAQDAGNLLKATAE